MLDNRKLRSFLAAAEYENFSKAGADLHLSQPTISHHIKSLEYELGTKLFERSGSHLVLTDAGKILLVTARKIVAESNKMMEIMASLKTSIAGEMTIACSTTAGKYVLPQLAARFCEKFPLVNIQILSCQPEHITQRLIGEHANLAVVSSEVIDQSLEYQTFFNDRINLIVHKDHPWVLEGVIDPSDLINEPFIIREATSGTRRVMLSQLAKFDIKDSDLNIFLELGNAEAIVRTVAAGYGVSFVSTLASSCQLERGYVVEVPVKGLELTRTIYMVRKKIGTHNRIQDAFWSFIHEEANQDLLTLPSIG